MIISTTRALSAELKPLLQRMNRILIYEVEE